jgi:hypothetical protein
VVVNGVGFDPVAQRNQRYQEITSALMSNPLQTVDINRLYQEDPELAKMVQSFVNNDPGFRAAESRATSGGPPNVSYTPPPTFTVAPTTTPSVDTSWRHRAPTSDNWTDPGDNWTDLPSSVQTDPGALLPGGWQRDGNAPTAGGNSVRYKQVDFEGMPVVNTDTSPGAPNPNVMPGGFDPTNGTPLPGGGYALGDAPPNAVPNSVPNSVPGVQTDLPGGGGDNGDNNGDNNGGGLPDMPNIVTEVDTGGTDASGGGGPFDNSAATGEEPPDFGGDVFQWEPPENNLLPQLEGLYQNMIDTLNGTRQSPYLAPLLADFDVRNERAKDNFEQALAVRGIANSTLADNARQNYTVQEQGGKTALALDTLNKEFTPQLALLGQIFNQGQTGRQQALNEFMQFLQAQYTQDALQSTNAQNALSLMLNAMGINTAPGAQAGNFTVPTNNNPSAASSAANFGGNAFLTWLMTQ